MFGIKTGGEEELRVLLTDELFTDGPVGKFCPISKICRGCVCCKIYFELREK